MPDLDSTSPKTPMNDLTDSVIFIIHINITNFELFPPAKRRRLQIYVIDFDFENVQSNRFTLVRFNKSIISKFRCYWPSLTPLPKSSRAKSSILTDWCIYNPADLEWSLAQFVADDLCRSIYAEMYSIHSESFFWHTFINFLAILNVNLLSVSGGHVIIYNFIRSWKLVHRLKIEKQVRLSVLKLGRWMYMDR